MENDNSNKLRWRFDVSTFRLIGRDLITDRITALFELVKNCYDANSTRVDIIFENISSINEDSHIIIKDNGYGMTFTDIRDKWMVIGTSSKRKEPYSPEPFSRRCVGEKGIGRFAVDKLGEKVSIVTKKDGESERVNVEINWDFYDVESKKQVEGDLKQDDKAGIESSRTPLFTDIDNNYFFEPADLDKHGTTLIISEIRDIWVERDIERLFKELSKMVSPFFPIDPPFDIYVTCKDYGYNEKLVYATTDEFASCTAKISYSNSKKIQEILTFDETTGKIVPQDSYIRRFGGINITFFYFNESAKKAYNAKYKNDDARIDGIKIYRDGLITTPFAEWESDRDKKRDIIGLDKRLWSDVFNRIGSREIIGFVEITKENNPQIIDATNRQDFVDNAEYSSLKDFIIEQVDVFSKLKKFEREAKGKLANEKLKNATQDAEDFLKRIEELERQKPELKTSLSDLKKKAKQVSTSVKAGLKEQEKSQKEFLRKENIYLSLMSLQDYAANMSHAVKTSLGKIKDAAEFFNMYFPNEKYESIFSQYAKDIFVNMESLSKIINYMLNYAKSNIPFEELNVKELINNLFSEYSFRFEKEGIISTIEIRDNFVIFANKQFFADIFQNLIDNSIKSLSQKEGKKYIKCSGYIENDQFYLYFSDNGIGIEEEQRERVFEIFYTTTAEKGGAGLGLYIVKTRLAALKGAIEVIENEFKPSGATFKITFPFKK